MDADSVCKRLSELKSVRHPHETVWRDCFDYTYPLRASGLDGSTLDAAQGARKRAEMMDSTATDSTRMLASAIMSGLTPANSRWFELSVDDEDEGERQWLDMVADLLWTNIHQANFDAEAYEACLDLVAAGWFCLYVDEDRRQGGLTFEQWPLAGCYVASTRSDGVVDTIYREHTLTAAAAVTEYGEHRVSKETRDLAQTKPQERVTFVHAIYPRGRGAGGGRLAHRHAFASVVVEIRSKHVVRERGYHEFPVMVPRWMRIPASSYGVGPVYDALPDIRTLNELKSMELASADVAISGMWIAEDDGVLNPRTVRIGPRRVVVANSVDSMKALQTGSNFKLSEVLTGQLQAAIRKTLMSDQLQPQDGPAMTATEVHVRVQLIRQLLGPIYGRLQAEYLRQLVERCFGLAWRAGVLPPPPRTLAGKDFSVKYVSPLARAQRMEDVTAIGRLYEMVGQVAAAKQDLSVFDMLNDEESVERTADGLGVPAGVLRLPDEVAAIRAQRQQAQEQQQQQAQEQQMQQMVLQQAQQQGGQP